MLSVLSRKTLHENVVQGCGMVLHMFIMRFFYRHFGVESVPDPSFSPPSVVSLEWSTSPVATRPKFQGRQVTDEG